MRKKFHIIYFTIIFSIFILIIFSAISTPIVSEDFNTSLIELMVMQFSTVKPILIWSRHVAEQMP